MNKRTSSSATAVAENTSCGCGHCHSEAHGHSHTYEDARSHDHPHREGGLELEGCGCGHDQGKNSHSLKREIGEIAISLVLAAAVMLFISNPILRAVLMVLSILVVGRDILLSGIKSIAKLDFNELALMSIAVVAASVIGECFEAYLVIMLFRIGEMLEDAAVAKSRREVDAITKIIPENANRLLADGSTATVGARSLRLSEQILVKSGERIPVDCTVLRGSSSVDSSSLTGESAPREVGEGDAVLSGMVNMGGILVCETTATFDNSTASRIIQMVKDSTAQKGNTEKLISKFARIYTPIVIILAVLITAIPPLLGFGGITMWLSRSLVFLVAACPCALVIATPLSYFAGIGACSKNGVLVKGGKYMEVLAKTGTIVIDKTGTLTTGKLSVGAVTGLNGSPDTEALALAAACERYSNHPIAKAVTAAAEGLPLPNLDRCEEITSYGMSATLDSDRILCGSPRLMAKYGVSTEGYPDDALFVMKNDALIGMITISDEPRADAKDMIAASKALGVSDIVMLTGDSKAAATETAGKIGITHVEAELLPQDKVTAFEKVKASSSGSVLFVGDGINDSPVIARADAGVAMGVGADAAIESADVVLLSDRLSSLPQAIRISKRTGRLTRFNITLSLVVKLAVFVLAVSGFASMWMAVFADVGVTILAVLNATRALRFR